MDMSFQQLKQQYANCQRCPELFKSRTQVVFGSGNEKAEILLIGEAPGFNEDQKGIPFCGQSGKILDELLKSISLSREDIFITNTLLCRPPGNRNPNKEEVENCRERLDQLIRLMKPKVIVTIGNFATERIIGKTGINSLRGKVFDYRGAEGAEEVQGVQETQKIKKIQAIKAIPTIHPASYLYSGRNPEMLEKMKNDFRKIKEVIGVGNSQKSQKGLGEF